jgi:hypothetical protein
MLSKSILLIVNLRLFASRTFALRLAVRSLIFNCNVARPNSKWRANIVLRERTSQYIMGAEKKGTDGGAVRQIITDEHARERA